MNIFAQYWILYCVGFSSQTQTQILVRVSYTNFSTVLRRGARSVFNNASSIQKDVMGSVLRSALKVVYVGFLSRLDKLILVCHKMVFPQFHGKCQKRTLFQIKSIREEGGECL